MIKHVIVYKMIDPISKHIRYIGITTKTLKKRLAAHINASQKKGKKRKVYCWLSGLLSKNLFPIMEIIEEFDEELIKHNGGYIFGKAGEREKYWIKYYKSIYKLTNDTEGGDGNFRKHKFEDYEKSCKKIKQYDKKGNFIKEWISISEAARAYNVGNGHIASCCKGLRHKRFIRGFAWRYSEDVFETHPGHSFNARKFIILQIDTSGNIVKEWPHSQDFENITGICRSFVTHRCNTPFNKAFDRPKLLKGYYYLYKHKPEDLIKLQNYISINSDTNCPKPGCTNISYKKRPMQKLCYKHYYYVKIK